MLTTSTHESDVTTLPRALGQQKLQVAMCRCATDEVRREAVQNKLNKCHWLSEDKHLPFRELGAVCCVSLSTIVRGTSPRQAMIVCSRSSEVVRDEENVPTWFVRTRVVFAKLLLLSAIYIVILQYKI